MDEVTRPSRDAIRPMFVTWNVMSMQTKERMFEALGGLKDHNVDIAVLTGARRQVSDRNRCFDICQKILYFVISFGHLGATPEDMLGGIVVAFRDTSFQIKDMVRLLGTNGPINVGTCGLCST